MSPTTENLSKRIYRVFATALIALVATGCAQDVDTAASERFMTATSRSTATWGY